MDSPGFDALTRRIFAASSRRSAVAGLASALALPAAWLTGRPAAPRRRPRVCRPLGHLCFPGRGNGRNTLRSGSEWRTRR